jgi:glycosyltransferase involved in cell wall biosynthesis
MVALPFFDFYIENADICEKPESAVFSMNYYFLPGVGIYGGIKVGFRFSHILDELGVKIVVVTPDGSAPSWFRCGASVISEAEAIHRIKKNDTIIFSLPHDYKRLKKISNKLIFHCQGTDPLIDPILLDPEVILLNCWQQAKEYMMQAGRESIAVGISLSDTFYYDGTLKDANLLSGMSRRGSDLISSIVDFQHSLTVSLIDGMHEDQVAAQLKKSTFYLATSEHEWFGLPALEAMAAGCVVLSVPVIGGIEYLKNEQNCFYGTSEYLKKQLQYLLTDNHRIRALQYNAISKALEYSQQNQTDILKVLLRETLNFLVH